MKRKLLLENPWVLTLPILLIFLVDVYALGKNVPLSDGIRYWQTASDILNGFRDTPVLEGYLLLNGPLYPLLLAFFKGLGFSVKACIFLNAGFLYIGFTYFLKTALQFLTQKKAIWVTYILVFVDPFLFYWGAKLYSEPLAILWMCLLLYSVSEYLNSPTKKNLLKAALLFCLLALTRVIFAYVIVALIPIGFLGYLLLKKEIYKKLVKLSSLSLLFCVPYLIFTYSITNKIFYWSGNGGLLLYWTSSPYKSDMGEWHTLQINHDHFAARYNAFSGLDSLYLRKVNDIIINEINNNHRPFVERLASTKGLVESDEALKTKAIENIKSHPASFLQNWFLNTGRLLVGIPHALYHKPPFSPFFTLVNTVKSSFVLCFLLMALVLFFRKPKAASPLLIWMLLVLAIYLGGQSLLAVQSQRFLLPIYPLMLMFIAHSFSNNIQILKHSH
jgi:hypothetical protein